MPGFTTTICLAWQHGDVDLHIHAIWWYWSQHNTWVCRGYQSICFYHLPSYLMHQKNIGDLASQEFWPVALQSAANANFTREKHSLSCERLHLWLWVVHTGLYSSSYVYAFTGYNADPTFQYADILVNPLFQTELDLNFYMKKHHCILPISMRTANSSGSSQRKVVIATVLCYMPEHFLSGYSWSELFLMVPFWMTWLFAGWSNGQKKMLRHPKIFMDISFSSPMVCQRLLSFLYGRPMNLKPCPLVHPWTKNLPMPLFGALWTGWKIVS